MGNDPRFSTLAGILQWRKQVMDMRPGMKFFVIRIKPGTIAYEHKLYYAIAAESERAAYVASGATILDLPVEA